MSSTCKDPKELAKIVAPLAAPGDLVVCLGAGSITYWAHALPAELQAIYGKPATWEHESGHGNC